MASLLLLSVIVAAASTVAPPAAPGRSVPTIIVTGADGERAQARAQIDVAMRGPEGLLWSGPLWIGSRGQTRWQQSLSEPADPACGPSAGYMEGQTELSVQLQPLSGSNWDNGTVLVIARWSRRAGGPCRGTRTVEIRETSTLVPNQRATLKGDGGFSVELHRR